MTTAPRENKNNAYAKFGGTNREYYGIFRNGLVDVIELRVFGLTRSLKDGILVRDGLSFFIFFFRYSHL